MPKIKDTPFSMNTLYKADNNGPEFEIVSYNGYKVKVESYDGLNTITTTGYIEKSNNNGEDEYTLTANGNSGTFSKTLSHGNNGSNSYYRKMARRNHKSRKMARKNRKSRNARRNRRNYSRRI
jgi:hypothetical protein